MLAMLVQGTFLTMLKYPAAPGNKRFWCALDAEILLGDSGVKGSYGIKR